MKVSSGEGIRERAGQALITPGPLQVAALAGWMIVGRAACGNGRLDDCKPLPAQTWREQGLFHALIYYR